MRNQGKDLLAELRRGRDSWSAVEYAEVDGLRDAHAVARHRVITALQYDLRDEDQALVRHLLEQEVRCRERDAEGSEFDTLHLAAYLLSTFSVLDDIWLFFRAKHANFDTASSFEEGFLLSCGVAATYRFLRASAHPSRDAVLGYLGPEEQCTIDPESVRAYWEEYFPAKEEGEALLTRIQRSIDFGDLEDARALFPKWQADLPARDKSTLDTLRRVSESLGFADIAVDAQRELVRLAQHDPWETVAMRTELAQVLIRQQRFEAAWDALLPLEKTLASFDQWKGYGLGRSVVETLLDLCLAFGAAHATAPAALARAAALLRQGSSGTPNIREKGIRAARLLADAKTERLFRDYVPSLEQR